MVYTLSCCVLTSCVSQMHVRAHPLKSAIPWKGADGLLRIHSAMDEHYIGRSGPQGPRALEILESGQADHAIRICNVASG